MSRADALAFGLLCCKHCNLPPNNHFGNGEAGGKCAHRPCPGYEETARVGKFLSEGIPAAMVKNDKGHLLPYTCRSTMSQCEEQAAGSKLWSYGLWDELKRLGAKVVQVEVREV